MSVKVRERFKGDYMGFEYNGVHSSELGIVRVSDGSRFNENLLPTIQDKTVQVPGGDGAYYFGSYYTQRQFSISFAFDDLTEAEVARLKSHFGDKGVHDLIFDEAPYKIYSAKVTGNATIKYLAFNEGDTNRLYKGEGSLQFTCYYPFARCWSTTKNDYKNHRAYQHYENEELTTDSDWEKRVNEWWDAARIESGKNFGDVPVPFTLVLDPTNGSTQIGLGNIDWSNLQEKSLLNTKTGVVLKLNDNDEPTKTIMNKYVSGDLTVKIPVGYPGPDGAQFTCLYI